ncbi:MAG: nitroreductase family protein [Synergistaceae bacterium]|jgi:nitroreductase|nr:nitroreductase family protein [Synergistaceae bacterium]
MRKPAPANWPLVDVIANRWSPRAFSARIPKAEILASLFEAARWAPSAFNEQPWRFLVATQEEPQAHATMLSCLVEANQTWAVKAPVLAVLLTKKTFSHNGKSNRWFHHDAGLALENLLLQAVAGGLVGHPMAGFDRDRIREIYAVPDDFDPVTAVALGYPGDPQELDDELRSRELAPRERLPLEQTVFSGSWGQAAPFVKE